MLNIFNRHSNTESLLAKQLENIKFLFEEEEKRQESIEKKLISLQGQIVLYISIISIYFATIFTIFQNLYSFYPLSLLFAICIILSWISLIHSTKMLNPSKYAYMTISPETLTRERKKTTELYSELISDLAQSVTKNHETNSRKADELIVAHKTFRYAISLGVVMILASIISTMVGNYMNEILQECLYDLLQHFG